MDDLDLPEEPQMDQQLQSMRHIEVLRRPKTPKKTSFRRGRVPSPKGRAWSYGPLGNAILRQEDQSTDLKAHEDQVARRLSEKNFSSGYMH